MKPSRRTTETVLLAALALAAACAAPPPRLVPPADVRAVEGYGSASVESLDAFVRGRFAFRFERPAAGRIEAFDPLGRTLYVLVFRGERAWFVVPSKRVYWENAAVEIMNRWLGFSLNPEDVVRLLSGRWDDAAGGSGEWQFIRDAQGRVTAGERGGLRFEVREFFPGAGAPRIIAFEDFAAAGRLRVLEARFNPPARDAGADLAFLETFSPVTWAELEALLEDGRGR
jgi:hypothetical protein